MVPDVSRSRFHPTRPAAEVLATATPDYHDAYALRRASSTMTSVAVAQLHQRLALHAAMRSEGTDTATAPSPLRILSLGCGDGDVDLPLLRALGATGPIEHVGVDVNRRSLDRFRDRIGHVEGEREGTTLSPSVSIELREGDLDDVADPIGFDVVLLSHVLYYVAEPVALVRRLLEELVRTDGLVIVVHSAHEGVPAVMAEAGMTPFLTAEDVAAALRDAGEPFTLALVPTELDATEVLARSDEGGTLLGFLVERDPASLTPDECDRLLAAVLARSTTRDGRARMREMLGILELRGDLAAARLPGSDQVVDDGPDPDPVRDYRVLAERFDWPARLRRGSRGPDGRRAILDVGCGTGRWLRALERAWPELRDDRDDRAYTAVDPAAGAVEAASEAARPILAPIAAHRTTVERLATDRAGRFDLVWAVHSLYAVAAEDLDRVVASLVALLRTDGLGIVVLPDAGSFYLRAGEEALGRRLFIGAEEVAAALTRAGIPHRTVTVAYDERIPASDDLALRRYLWDESIGNSYAPAGGASEGGPAPQPVAPWWAAYRHGAEFRFPQRVRVITFRGR